jgi:hypothetical protein
MYDLVNAPTPCSCRGRWTMTEPQDGRRHALCNALENPNHRIA